MAKKKRESEVLALFFLRKKERNFSVKKVIGNESS
jgi:hypothetical protein